MCWGRIHGVKYMEISTSSVRKFKYQYELIYLLHRSLPMFELNPIIARVWIIISLPESNNIFKYNTKWILSKETIAWHLSDELLYHYKTSIYGEIFAWDKQADIIVACISLSDHTPASVHTKIIILQENALNTKYFCTYIYIIYIVYLRLFYKYCIEISVNNKMHVSVNAEQTMVIAKAIAVPP